MTEAIIRTRASLVHACDELAVICPDMRRALSQLGEIPLRRRRSGFVALADAIIGQQISVAAAASIRARLHDAGLLNEDRLIGETIDNLRNYGLSKPKASYILALAQARIDYGALRKLPTQEVIARLIEVKGIGIWTAEIYAMFSLGRADAFAAGDLALQESARMLLGLDHRPTERELREIAQRWQPWRAVAARILWAYYHLEKDKEGIL